VTVATAQPNSRNGDFAQHHLRLGGRSYPVVLPNVRDPRIHLSLVTLTIFGLGIGWLGFRVSIAQILVAMLTCACIEVAVTMRKAAIIVWPASALQTASSTALLLRVDGTANGDYWSLRGWYYFAGVAAFGLATKHLVRFRGGHVFNPSNIALVLAFLVIGSDRIEPLDFWWAPLDFPMLAAFAVILSGGVLICRQLHLIAMGIAFWVTLAIGLGVLAATGHSITARWSLSPIGGLHFWWVILTSPEIMIFLLFMLTDPKTVPIGRCARIAFGVIVAAMASIMIAPWETEFGAKVALLSSLAIACALRPLIERHLPAAGTTADDPLRWAGGMLRRRRLVVPAALGMFSVSILAASIPARVPAEVSPPSLPGITMIDPASLPNVTIDREVGALSAQLATREGAQDLAATLAWNLMVEAEALVTRDASLLAAVDHGERLAILRTKIESLGTDDLVVVPNYQFETLHLIVVFPGGAQRGANAGLVAVGSVSEVTYRPDGSEQSRSEQEFELTFALRRTTSGRWQISDIVEVPV
jgi:Na+-translocating ferredoxin:NAD+ oxidoreductase RnfD subunit